MHAADGILVTGVYGAGKSSVVEELAEMLERHHLAYLALDLDWLRWFHVPGQPAADAQRTYLANVAAVVGHAVDAGVSHVVAAMAVRDRDEVDELARAMGVSLRVARLDVPRDEIIRRLEASPTTGRGDDLVIALEWLDGSIGHGAEDRCVRNDRPVRETAAEILDWLGWTRGLSTDPPAGSPAEPRTPGR